jgi:hypothetical protein
MAQAAAPQMKNFAYGYPLPLVEGDGVYAITLPLMVYEKISQSDLSDIRVFNGAGETVPHAIRSAVQKEKRNEIRQPVPFFPLNGAPPSSTADLSLRVVRNADGAVVTVDAGSRTAANQPSSWYLLDTSRLDKRPTALELQWTDKTTTVFTVSLAHSNDLSHWVPLLGQTVLADLRYNGNAVTARRIALPRKTLPYIRLDCLDCQQPLQLREVLAVSGGSTNQEAWQWLTLRPEQTKEIKGEVVCTYLLKPKIRVSALQLGFAQSNTLVRAEIESRPGDDSDWHLRTRSSFYALTLQGKTLVNEPVPCPSTADRFWRLSVTTDGSGLSAGTVAPQLKLGWRQDQLIFVGRGAGPYTLAFGSTQLADTVPRDDLLLATMRDTGLESLTRHIEPGPLTILGGEQVLQPHLSAASWKKMLLWGVLLAGVALLAFMAWTIYREMQTKDS